MYHIVVNPAARTGNGKKMWEEKVQPYLKHHNILYKVWFSEGKGDLIRIGGDICSSEIERPIRIVVLGGDGTMNEFLQGLHHTEDIVLGYIPTGSGNDLARGLRIPADTAQALDIVFRSGHPALMDVGTVIYPDGKERRFLVSCGMGFDAAVCEEAMHSKLKAVLNRMKLGKLTYLLIAIKQIFAAGRADGTLILDGTEVIPFKKLLFLAGMNQRYEGGGFEFTPDARDDDGYLNICMAQNISTPRVFMALPLALKGKHTGVNGISIYRCKEFGVKADRQLWVKTDGEVQARPEGMKASVRQKAIHMMRP
ncbi:MAG: YegS/Rv2252/BmrU family lipid kinase [Lachnospiraceae bacterium]|nr:YegS/Rv2252/BmrU family lipid kinase [Lachnospiraceae bacterium]